MMKKNKVIIKINLVILKVAFRQFILMLFVFFGQLLIAQNNSLENDKLAVDTLFFSDPNKALEISENQLSKAFELNDTFHITYFLDQAGELNRKAGNYDKAIAQLHQCLKYKVNWELKDLSLTHNNLGKTYLNKGLYDLSIFHFLEALKLMEIDNNLMGQGFYLNNIAAVYDLQHNYEKALEYYHQSLNIKIEIGDSTGVAASYTNLGITYLNLKEYEKALFYNQKAYTIYHQLGSPSKIARTLNNLGEINLKLKKDSEAFYYLNKAYSMDSMNDDNYLRTNIISNLGRYYLKKNNTDSAMYFTKIAESMALCSKAFKNLKDVYLLKSEIAKSQGDLENALIFLYTHISYNDSLLNEANIYAVSEMAAKYEHEKKLRIISEAQLSISEKEQQIEQQKTNIFYGIGISVLFIVISIVFVVLYFIKQRNSQLLHGQLTLIAKQNKKLEQLNFTVKNQLDTLQITLEEKENLLNNIFSKPKTIELPPELLALSKREMEVLSYLALGWSDDQLAEKLFISKSTVKTHLQRIYSKLSARGRTEAVSIAHKYDLLGES